MAGVVPFSITLQALTLSRILPRVGLARTVSYLDVNMS